MRVMFQKSPFEYLFALLMAASPCVGCIWVTPDVTKWIVFGTGVAMILAVMVAAVWPIRSRA